MLAFSDLLFLASVLSSVYGIDISPHTSPLSVAMLLANSTRRNSQRHESLHHVFKRQLFAVRIHSNYKQSNCNLLRVPGRRVSSLEWLMISVLAWLYVHRRHSISRIFHYIRYLKTGSTCRYSNADDCYDITTVNASIKIHAPSIYLR